MDAEKLPMVQNPGVGTKMLSVESINLSEHLLIYHISRGLHKWPGLGPK
jgi:hypothetical protein